MEPIQQDKRVFRGPVTVKWQLWRNPMTGFDWTVHAGSVLVAQGSSSCEQEATDDARGAAQRVLKGLKHDFA